MTINRLTESERSKTIDILRSACTTDVLERALSEEQVYLGFQPELLKLSPNKRHDRLATLVATLFGDSLLASSALRRALCQSKKIEAPATWSSGTESASDLCRALGLPEILSGQQLARPVAVIQRLSDRPFLPDLLDYQLEAKESTYAQLKLGSSVLLSMPTGSGKTRVAAELVRDWHEDSNSSTAAIWLAHTEELCEQAVTCIMQMWAAKSTRIPAAVIRCWGRHAKRLLHGEVFQEGESSKAGSSLNYIVVSTPQTLRTILGSVSTGTLGAAFKKISLVVTDEAHRAATPIYDDVFRKTRIINSSTRFLGLSATPVRESYSSRPYEGTIELSKYFTKLIEPTMSLGEDGSPVRKLQERGVLANLEVKQLGNERLPFEDLIYLISKQLQLKKSNSPALFFTPTASEAKIAAMKLTELGHLAEFVTGDTSNVERLNIIQLLKSSEISVLCNCEILTTGFDAPNVDTIFLARATKSPVLYKQIVGRGLRGPAMGGSNTCTLFLCGVTLPFDYDPNTSAFARAVWSS